MDRRTVIKGIGAAGALAATGRLSAPAIAQGAKVIQLALAMNEYGARFFAGGALRPYFSSL